MCQKIGQSAIGGRLPRQKSRENPSRSPRCRGKQPGAAIAAMVVMPRSRLVVGSITTAIRLGSIRPMLMVAGLEDDSAEWQMVVAARCTGLVLNPIDYARRAGARKGKRQRDTKRRAKPKKSKAKNPNHDRRA